MLKGRRGLYKPLEIRGTQPSRLRATFYVKSCSAESEWSPSCNFGTISSCSCPSPAFIFRCHLPGGRGSFHGTNQYWMFRNEGRDGSCPCHFKLSTNKHSQHEARI